MKKINWTDVASSLIMAAACAIVLGLVGKIFEVLPRSWAFGYIKRIYQYIVWSMPMTLPNIFIIIGCWMMILACVVICITFIIQFIKKYFCK